MPASNTVIMRAYLAAACVAAAGITVSLADGQWHWFARSGALVVVIGILLTSHQITRNIRRLRQQRARHDPSAAGSAQDWADDANLWSRLRHPTHDEAQWDNERFGFYLLVVGTLIWGFGDLVHLLLP